MERPTEVYFNVIHKKKHENHQKLILHLNINTKNINLLRINRQIFRQIEMNKILSVANCNFDSRRIYLSWSRNEKKKIEDLIFNDIKTKFVFLSAVYSVLVYILY